ncbi:MAG: FecR family protein [Armatimonadota bacterium]
MRKAATLLILVAVICIFVGAVITQSVIILQRVAAVSDAQGPIQVKPRGQEEFVLLGDRARVNAGDVVKTGDKAGLVLSWLDGTRMRIGPNTVMTVLKCQINTVNNSETTMFKLDLGRVWIRVLKVLSQKSKFEVVTPTATAGVRGTVFSVAVSPEGKTTVSVVEGAVALEAAGKHSLVEKGHMSTASASGAQVQPLAAEEDRLWQSNASVANPNLTISEPAAGSTVPAGSQVTIKGRAELGAKVTIADQPVPVRLKGLFDTTVKAPAKPGPFEIKVRVTDARDYVTSETLKLEVATP